MSDPVNFAITEFSEVALAQRDDVRLLMMANVHYARIGDVWKHLPLAEVLSIERPGRYWESHAGSSTYPLTRSPERDYGVFYFLEHTNLSSALKSSAYRRLLEPCERGSTPPTYPGSPLIALKLLKGAGEHFVFCDVDGASLANIAEDARALRVSAGRVRLVHGDGIPALEEELAGLAEGEASGTFLHVDPYRPLERERGGESPLGLFARAAEQGVGCMLWYGFDSRDARAVVPDALRKRIAGHAWYGEVCLHAEDLSEVGFDPGVLGCGVVVCNVGQEALAACSHLGEGLAHAYASARRLPNGRDGALEFEEDTF
jgi:23S rRNA A2030 N6-methylase RlmJ